MDSIIKKPTVIKQTMVNFSIKSAKQNKECKEILSKLESDGWKVIRNRTQDVVCISLEKESISPSDVKLFEKLAKYAVTNSSMCLTPEPFKPATPSIWWFFERGQMRESHWGVEI